MVLGGALTVLVDSGDGGGLERSAVLRHLLAEYKRPARSLIGYNKMFQLDQKDVEQV